MKFKRCEHYAGECPCMTCEMDCCVLYADKEGNAIDTDVLCEQAKAYCESGRDKGE